MRLIVITANLMQRLSGLPATPDITLLHLGKSKPHPRSHTNTTFRELTYIRWCCIDLSNAPCLSACAKKRKCWPGGGAANSRTVMQNSVLPSPWHFLNEK